MGAGDLARGIAARHFSASEAVAALLERQDEVQPKINAVVVSLAGQAMAAAKAADQGRPRDGQKLYGVPVTVKECFDVVGTATTAGLIGRAATLVSDDAELVSRLRATPGRLSLAGTADEFLFDHLSGVPDSAGPIARSVADLKLAMDVLGSPVPDARLDGLVIGMYDDDGFMTASAAVRRAVRQAASALETAGARIVSFEPPAVLEALDIFYGMFTADGAAAFVKLIAGERTDSRVAQLVQLATMSAWMRPVLGAGLTVAGQRRLSHLIRTTGVRTPEETQALVARRDAYRNRFESAVAAAGVDALLCPPNALPALTHGASADLGPGSVSYTALYNILGWPAGVVPVTRVRPGEMDRRPRGGDMMDRAARRVDKDSAGLPVGVQVAARPNREDLILAVMGAVEAALSGSVDYPRVPPALA